MPEIPGGYILLARKMLTSGVMDKPPLYLKLWIWMLMQSSHKDHGKFKRGQFFSSWSKMREAMAYDIGCVKKRPTIKEIRGVCDFLRKGAMIDTTKVTHGQLITIRNYDHYQEPCNYEGRKEGRNDFPTKGAILTRKDNKKENERDFSNEKRVPLKNKTPEFVL